MKYLFFLAALILMLTAQQCTTKSAQTSNSTKSNATLFKTWLQSSEEEKYHGDYFYRPKSYKFPTSGPRKGFTIHPGGKFVEYVNDPDDGWKNVVGNWEMRDSKILVITFPDGSRQPYLLEIESLESEMLKVTFNYRMDGSEPNHDDPVVPY